MDLCYNLWWIRMTDDASYRIVTVLNKLLSRVQCSVALRLWHKGKLQGKNQARLKISMRAVSMKCRPYKNSLLHWCTLFRNLAAVLLRKAHTAILVAPPLTLCHLGTTGIAHPGWLSIPSWLCVHYHGQDTHTCMNRLNCPTCPTPSVLAKAMLAPHHWMQKKIISGALVEGLLLIPEQHNCYGAQTTKIPSKVLA